MLLQWLAPVLGHPRAPRLPEPPEGPLASAPDHAAEAHSGFVAQNFDAIYQEHFDFVWRSVCRLGVSSAEVDDAAHDVFLVVHKKLGEFDGRASIRSWLFAISQRVAWHYRRSQTRRRTEPLADDDPQDPRTANNDGDQARREATTLIHRVLGELSEERRAVFILSELENMTMPQIADLLHLPLNTAYSRLRLARRDFEKKLRIILAANRSEQAGRRP